MSEFLPIAAPFAELVRSVFRQQVTVWPAASDPEVDRFLDRARHHGLEPLLHERARMIEGLPAHVANRWRSAIIHETANEPLRDRMLSVAISAARDASAPLLVFKGEALARILYDAPHLRPRADLDVLVPRRAVEPIEAALSDAGFAPAPSVDGASTVSQSTWSGVLRGSKVSIDLHWRLFNLLALAPRLRFEELWKRSLEVHFDGGMFRCPSLSDALLIGAAHLAAHHPGEERLIWLYDLHLLFEAMSSEEAERFFDRAGDHGLVSICAVSLNRAREWFATTGPEGTTWPIPAREGEPLSRLIGPRTRLEDFRLQIRELPTPATKLRYLMAQLFPPRRYMNARYPGVPGWRLPLFYLWRILRGIPRLFRSS